MSLFKKNSAGLTQETAAQGVGNLFPHAVTSSEAPQVKLPRGFREGLRGIARNVEKRELAAKRPGQHPSEYLGFVLERTDEIGNVIEQIPVEVRAEEIAGRIVRDGDKVIVKGRRNRHGLLEPKAIYVISTNSIIEVKRHGFIWLLFALPIGLLGVASFFGLIIGLLMGAARSDATGWMIAIASIIGLSISHYFFKK